MKVTSGIVLPAILIIFLTAVFAYAQPEPKQPPQPPQPAMESADSPEEQPDRQGLIFDESYINKLLEDLKQTDPDEAQRLEKLRQENPRLFQIEMRKLAWQQHRSSREGFEPNRLHRGGLERPFLPGQGGPMDRGRLGDRMAMESEFITWLEKNEPEKAKELAAIKAREPEVYRKSLTMEMKKYREIIRAEKTNPALAELLKKDLVLKQRRNELLENLKNARDEKQKAEITGRLKEVLGERFDIILQKKQLQYEELKKKLQELQKDVDKSQAELKDFKNSKEKHINNHLKELTDPNEQFDWD